MAQEFRSQDTPSLDDDASAPACVMCFNANDASGAGGLGADQLTVASVGAHPLGVVTGIYIRDSAEIFDHIALDEDTVGEQARVVLEDSSVQVFKVGFCGTPENLSVVAQTCSDYAQVPVVAYMPNLSWWDEDQADAYQDAFMELLLPQTTVLVGNHSTLWRWLLPDWSQSKSPGPRDLARAASEKGVPYLLVTGIVQADQQIENALATPMTVLATERFEHIDAVFSGAGDTLSAALAALLAAGTDLEAACLEALNYLDHCLDSGFRSGMGHVVPDRLFWAHGDDDDSDGTDVATEFALPPHETKH
jgi:hydroxymethylpyrimidine/phosphomethylpyrimidine kinase